MLKAAGVDPSVVYIDADHHYDGAYKDVRSTLEKFPKAIIVGDDWDYVDVRRAAKELSEEFGRDLYVEQGKCWALMTAREEDLKESRAMWTDNVTNSEEHQKVRVCEHPRRRRLR